MTSVKNILLGDTLPPLPDGLTRVSEGTDWVKYKIKLPIWYGHYIVKISADPSDEIVETFMEDDTDPGEPSTYSTFGHWLNSFEVMMYSRPDYESEQFCYLPQVLEIVAALAREQQRLYNEAT